MQFKKKIHFKSIDASWGMVRFEDVNVFLLLHFVTKRSEAIHHKEVLKTKTQHQSFRQAKFSFCTDIQRFQNSKSLTHS